jgi:predicted kinase
MKAPGNLWICRGLPASGKTTWAREQIDACPPGEVVRLNRDDLRRSMLPTTYREPVFHAEEQVSKVQHGPIVALLRAGIGVIVDDTNLRTKNVRNLAMLAAQADASWSCVDFLDVPLEECLRRDAARADSVGEEVIRRMFDKFLSGGRTLPVPVLDATVTGKPYIPVPGTPPAVIVDVDGTVALHGSRNPYDTSRYHEDTPNATVVEAIRNEDQSNVILFCSGRSEEFREVTEQWLAAHVAPPGDEDIFTIDHELGGWQLFMRPAGDTRNDAIVKLELFDQYIRDRYDVRRCYDDRDRVVSAYRSIGLTVLQVAPGNF